jgi:hypothetical protein
MNRSIFAKVAAAKASSKGDYIKGGRGQAVVLMCQGKETGGLSVPTFIAEVKILTSEAKPGQMSEGAPAVAPAPGSVCGWVQKFDKKPAENATKAFILNLLGFQESEVSVEEFVQTMEQLVAKDPKGPRSCGQTIGSQVGPGGSGRSFETTATNTTSSRHSTKGTTQSLPRR